jgi:hypothetical protein
MTGKEAGLDGMAEKNLSVLRRQNRATKTNSVSNI